jgi:hyperosmotically inducible protein
MKTRSPRLLLGSTLAVAATTLLIACNKAPEAPQTQSPPSTVGTLVDDSVITSSVKTALLADPDIKSFDISVLTIKGEVQLTGIVDNQGQIDQAARIARAAEGASSVKNELSIKP